jgi:hypothetical protein
MTDFFSDFLGPAFDTAHGYNAQAGMAIRDGARQSRPGGSRYRAVARSVKICLSCHHWARLHPGHGPCVGMFYHSPGHANSCVCAGFVDPEVGRPDRVYTRDQVDRMLRYRWEAVKDRIYLLRDGRYGLWDQWSSEEWKAKPGQRFTF